MKSKIAEAIKLKYHPVGILWTDQKPEKVLEFQPGKWGCVVSLFAQATKGKTAVFSRDTFGCIGGGVGLGFGNPYKTYMGGIECFYRFLSSGNSDWEHGLQVAEKEGCNLREESFDNFLHGERYIKNPELAKLRVENMPMLDIPAKYVVFKPLSEIDNNHEIPEIVIFTANPDQISALVVLANYARETNQNVIAPFGAGCHTLGVWAYQEAKSPTPRAIIGLTDLSARHQVANSLGRNYLTFAVPFKMYVELENNVEGSFLERHTWQGLLEKLEP
jgi:uncharacterized protein (DUF169 family)